MRPVARIVSSRVDSGVDQTVTPHGFGGADRKIATESERGRPWPHSFMHCSRRRRG
ncbi:protein of unknown function [Caballeronia sp. S22]